MEFFCVYCKTRKKFDKFIKVNRIKNAPMAATSTLGIAHSAVNSRTRRSCHRMMAGTPACMAMFPPCN